MNNKANYIQGFTQRGMKYFHNKTDIPVMHFIQKVLSQ